MLSFWVFLKNCNMRGVFANLRCVFCDLGVLCEFECVLLLMCWRVWAGCFGLLQNLCVVF